MPNAVGLKAMFVPGLTGAYSHIQENQANARTVANPQGLQPTLGALGTHSGKGGSSLGGQNPTQSLVGSTFRTLSSPSPFSLLLDPTTVSVNYSGIGGSGQGLGTNGMTLADLTATFWDTSFFSLDGSSDPDSSLDDPCA